MLSSLFKVSPIATCPDEACLVVDFSGTNYDCNIPNVSVCFKLFSKALEVGKKKKTWLDRK